MIALKKVLYQDRMLNKLPVVGVTITRLKESHNILENLLFLWMKDLGTIFVMYSVRISNLGSRNPVHLLTNVILVDVEIIWFRESFSRLYQEKTLKSLGKLLKFEV